MLSGNVRRIYFRYLTAALISTVILAAVCWGAVLFLDIEMLTLFGAEETLLPLAKEYLAPIKFVIPAFLFNQMLAAFLRNDDVPGLSKWMRIFAVHISWYKK